MVLTGHRSGGLGGYWLPCLIAGMALVSAGCARAGQAGELEVNASFSGRVPGGGHLKLGAVNSQGRTIAAGTIAPRTHKIITLPAGDYTIAVWLPGAVQLTTHRDLCSARATVKTGQISVLTLSCQWH
jgi:hypothetical protein